MLINPQVTGSRFLPGIKTNLIFLCVRIFPLGGEQKQKSNKTKNSILAFLLESMVGEWELQKQTGAKVQSLW